MVAGRAGTYRTRVRGRSDMADAGPPRRAGGARCAKERVYRARERAGRAREWDGGGAREVYSEYGAVRVRGKKQGHCSSTQPRNLVT